MDDRQHTSKQFSADHIAVLNYFKALKKANLIPTDGLKQRADSVELETKGLKSESPFLSIITRTQGKRPEALTAVLDCLSQQNDQDFEVLLIFHSGQPTEEQWVRSLVAQQSSSLQHKIRFMRLDGGTRTAPLNFGLQHARGQYMAVLDDDDLVSSNWVDNFHQAALRHPDAIIRCYGQSQLWKTEIYETGQRELVPLTDLDNPNTYCTPFSIIRHLSENETPISCAAYPLNGLRTFGLTFDESLTTTEDWDFFVRCALLFEVVDTKKITFIYRIWKNAESSRSLHNEEEWLDNKAHIFQKWDQMPIVVTRKELCENHSDPLLLQPLDIRHPGSFIWRYLKRSIKERIKQSQKIRYIQHSVFFDPEWYCDVYPEVQTSGEDPALHYLWTGWTEMKDPSPGFSTRKYLLLNPDVAKLQICPLLHYEQHGRSEGRRYERAD